MRLRALAVVVLVAVAPACAGQRAVGAPEFVITKAEPTRTSDGRGELVVDVRNDAADASGPICLRTEWLDGTELLEIQETCNEAWLSAGKTLTFVLHSYRPQPALRRVIVTARYAGVSIDARGTITVAISS